MIRPGVFLFDAAPPIEVLAVAAIALIVAAILTAALG